MNIQLSWDLFILVFFAVVVAYSFIIGRNQTLKVITGTYVAILCADGFGNLFAKYLAVSPSFIRFLKLFAIGNEDQATAFFKVLMLVLLIVIIAVKGLYSFDAGGGKSLGIRMGVLLTLGVLSAGLMISTMLIFVSGTSLVTNAQVGNNILTEIYGKSRLVKIMLDYANFWFFLPGVALVFVSLFSKKSA